METNLGMDRIQERPIEGMIARWKRNVERLELLGPFSMFYIAGPDQKQEIAINYVASQLNISEDDRITVSEPSRMDLLVVLGEDEIVDKVRSLKGKRVLIIAKGFEQHFLEKHDKSNYYRMGHDWDQDVVENANNRKLGRLYNGMEKHLVIITTIGFSYGQEAYEEAVKSATQSQFTNGIIELGE